MSFKIGQVVYVAVFEREEYRIPCPDCGGTKKIRVLLADDTMLSIDCGGCDPGGYEPPRGWIPQWRKVVRAIPRTVTSVIVSADAPVEYRLDASGGHAYCGTDLTVFATEPEALAYGETIRAESEAEENRRALAKTRNEKSWAWNYSYHRREAMRARAEAERHEAKALVCKAHVKETPDGGA